MSGDRVSGSEASALYAELTRVHRVVAALDAIDGEDPEGTHDEADRLLLSTAPLQVQAAYGRLVARARWWATA